MLNRVGGVLSEVGRIVRSSHEHYDGSGYPDGLAGEEIPIEARIVTCCDAFSAMTTTRSYRKAMSVRVGDRRAAGLRRHAVRPRGRRARSRRSPSSDGSRRSRARCRGAAASAASCTGEAESAWTRRSLQVRPSRTSAGRPRVTAVAISTACRITP